MSSNKNIKLIINYVLGPLLFLALFYTLREQLLQRRYWYESLQQIKKAFTGSQAWKIWLTILFMLVNWGLEGAKWRYSIRSLQPISFLKAFKAILTGSSLASFTPNRTGEYVGRLLYLEENKRIASIPLSLVTGMAQLMITLWAGLLALLYFKHTISQNLLKGLGVSELWIDILFGGTLFASAILTIFYFRLSYLVRLLQKAYKGKYARAFQPTGRLETKALAVILLLSALRYLVFIVQYCLLFSVFEVTLSWSQAFAGVSAMFLFLAVIPSFTFLTDLGLRWELGLQIMQIFSSNIMGIFAVSLCIWIINLIIPALIGSLLILNIKLFRYR